MRKAFTLVEILIVIATIPVFMMIISRLLYTLMRETPRIWNDVQQNSTMLNMLSQIQRDIDKASDFPQSQGEYTSGDKMLLIQQENALISYELGNEQVIRKVLSNEQVNTGEERIWVMPQAKIEWIVKRKDGKGFCLEIHNSIEYQNMSRLENKLPNSHLYFIGAM